MALKAAELRELLRGSSQEVATIWSPNQVSFGSVAMSSWVKDVSVCMYIYTHT